MDRVQEFGGLRGQQITSWSGVEMALREEAASGRGPQLEDSAAACLQMHVLLATTSDATVVSIDTYQDDDGWGLWLGQRRGDDSSEWNGIYRLRALPELPTGEVDDVSVVIDENILAEVVLSIHGRPLLLVAGEVYESAGDRLTLVRRDESVLVFTDPSAAESVDWIPDRRSPVLG